MKWFFDLFKNNEEEEIDREHNSQNVMDRKKEWNKGREMETRISYQYPKGEFRFPLIPDDDRETKKHPSLRERDRKQEINVPIPTAKIKVEPVIKQKKVKVENKSTRPFKPTDIPSPIYGFKERTEKYKPTLQMENKESGKEKNTSSIDQEKKRIQKPLFDQSTIVMVKDDPKNRKVEEVQEISSLQKVEMEAVVEPNHLPILEEQEEVSEVVELATEPQEVPEVTESEEDTEAIELVPQPEDVPAIVELNTEPEEVPEAIEPVTEPEEDTEAIELVPQPEDVPAIVELNTEPEEVSEAIELVTEPEEDTEAIELVPQPEDVPAIVELNTEPEEVPEAIEPVTEPEEDTEAIELVPQPEDVPAIVELNTEPEEVPEAIEPVTEPEEDTEAVELVPQPEDVPAIVELNREPEEVPEAIELVTEPEEVPAAIDLIEEREEEPTLRKSVIPFNVIMLNHDKRKLPKQRKNPSILSVREQTESSKPTLVEPESDLNYEFPSVQLLTPPAIVEDNGNWIEELKDILDKTLENFNVGARVVNVTQGPSVTRFEVQPEPGVKVNKITNLSDDIKLSLAARDIRMEAPIPGKHTIGIEVPNKKSRPVFLSEIVNDPEFLRQESPLTAILGLDISGKPIVTDLRKMPHGLIAGATGSGKSVCINTILVSLLYKARPEELKLLLIDPKMVELAPYNRIPHLVSPVITDVKAATAALKWAVEEMDRRYELFAHTGVRDIGRFNELAEKHKQYADKLPYIVIVIDELADLMMMSPADVEEAICRIAQKARACGIHLIIATQRPSVDVITGLIKANIPTRIAFSVSSQVDSRTIIDMSGAEKLLGRGDMLFLENGSSKPVRLQGTFVSDEEIDEVVAHVRQQSEPHYLFEQEELLKKAQITEDEDELFYEACEFVVEHGGASSSSLQRRFKIGYNRAARLIDMMEQQGFISEARGSKPRDVLITEAELETLQEVKMN